MRDTQIALVPSSAGPPRRHARIRLGCLVACALLMSINSQMMPASHLPGLCAPRVVMLGEIEISSWVVLRAERSPAESGSPHLGSLVYGAVGLHQVGCGLCDQTILRVDLKPAPQCVGVLHICF